MAATRAGAVSLTASALTAPYAARFGPRASFVLAGRRAGSDLFAFDGRVASENLSLRATGLGDLGERRLGPQGLALTAETAALSKITGGPDIGPTRIVGRINQAKAGWAFAGSAAVSRAGVGQYALAQASGPLEIAEAAGQWDIKTRLAGAGGRGTGYLAALLGGAPRASFDGARLADGRLLMRELQVTGAGLKLDATGGRGLLGGLTFKGRAALSNLAVAHVGAAGSAALTWSAGQGRAGQPWTFSAHAKGDRFATGYPEFDRLLGTEPQLKTQANLLARRLTITHASLNGAALNASTAGVLAPDGGLAFKVDWSASGPFQAGPIEIAGKAQGSGAITGSLATPHADLTADLAEIDAPRLPLKDAHLTLSFARKPDGSSGAIALTATSTYGLARARSDFRFPEGGIDLTGLSVDAGGLQASGSLSLRRRAPSAADLQIAVTRGAFLDGGKLSGTVRLVEAAGSPHAALNLTAVNLQPFGTALTVRAGKITAEGPLDRLPYAIQATGASDGGAWGFNGRGTLAEAKPGYAASFDGQGRLGKRDLRTAETAQFRFGGPEQSARLKLAASDGGRVDLDGRLSDAGTDIRAQLSNLTLGLLDEDLTGKTDATLSLQGARRAARRDPGGQAQRGARARHAGGLRHRRDRARPARRRRAVARPHRRQRPGPDRQRQRRAAGGKLGRALPHRHRSPQAPARQLRRRRARCGRSGTCWSAASAAWRARSWRKGPLGGTLNSPEATGQIAVDAGRFDDGATGLSLRNIALKADFAREAVSVTSATGVDGHGGSVAGTGRISLVRAGTSSFRLDLKGFRLIDNDLATASATGQATIDRTADGKVRLSGALRLDRADVAARLPTPSGVVVMDVVEKHRPTDLPAALPPPSINGGWALDVTLKAPRGVFLKGHGLDTELSLDAHVAGTTAHPDLTGTARVVRGDYDFAGKRFEFDSSSVVYLSTKAEQVRLDLTATRDDPTLTASVRIRGTAARPEISLTSTPSLPNDEVLSQVLFGRTASQLSPLEGAQLASALSSLAGGGGFDVIGNLRTFAGLDRLALGGGDAVSGAVSISGGKYLTDNVYLELTGGGRDGGAAQVEWRVKRNLSILSRVGGQGAGRLAVRLAPRLLSGLRQRVGLRASRDHFVARQDLGDRNVARALQTIVDRREVLQRRVQQRLQRRDRRNRPAGSRRSDKACASPAPGRTPVGWARDRRARRSIPPGWRRCPPHRSARLAASATGQTRPCTSTAAPDWPAARAAWPADRPGHRPPCSRRTPGQSASARGRTRRGRCPAPAGSPVLPACG